MKSNTLLIYGAESKLSPEHQELKTPSGDSYFIRITEKAEPVMDRECLLNYIDVGVGDVLEPEPGLQPGHHINLGKPAGGAE